jgi:hypothetical protein
MHHSLHVFMPSRPQSNPLSVKPLWDEKLPTPAAAAPAMPGQVIDLTGPQVPSCPSWPSDTSTIFKTHKNLARGARVCSAPTSSPW